MQNYIDTTYSQAILHLRPNAIFTIIQNDYSTLVWLDENQTQPSEEEIKDKVKELEDKRDYFMYQEYRATEYPHFTEFIDAYYWAQKGNTALMEAYTAKCDAVKAKYPKPINN